MIGYTYCILVVLIVMTLRGAENNRVDSAYGDDFVWHTFAIRFRLFAKLLGDLIEIYSKEDCSKPILAPGTLAKYTFESETFSHGTKLLFFCKAGYYFQKIVQKVRSGCKEYEYDGENGCDPKSGQTKDTISFNTTQRKLECIGPYWSSPAPSCIAFTCPVPTVSNGRWRTNQPRIKHREVVTITCDPGYLTLGSPSIKCSIKQANINDGWNIEPPSCREIKCAQPKRPENGIISNKNSSNQNRIGAEIEIICQRYFLLDGSKKRKCMANGRWSGTDATCQPTRVQDIAHCPVPVIPYGAKRYCERKSGDRCVYDEGAVVTYKCFDEFISGGPSRIKCNGKGHWEPADLPKCEALFSFDDPKSLARNFGELFDKIHKIDEYLDTDVGRILDLNAPGGCDITFLLDSSGSITQDEFDDTIAFIKLFAEKVGVSKRHNGVRFAALSFAANATNDFDANYGFHTFPAKTVEEVKGLLDKLGYISGGTNIRGALTYYEEEMLRQNRGKRKDAKQYLFLFSDGQYNLGGNPEDVASRLRSEKKVEIFVMKMGNGKEALKEKTNTRVLMSISSENKFDKDGNKDQHFFQFKDYSSVINFLVQMLLNGSIDYSECGVAGTTNITDGDIIRDKPANLFAWPWMVAVMEAKANNVKFREHTQVCGGTVLDNEWILTAAHCFQGDTYNNPRRVMVKLGAIDFKKALFDRPDIFEMKVRSMHIHEKWSVDRDTKKKFANDTNWAHDIALLRLDREVPFSKSVRPICLIPENTSNNEIKDKIAVVTGWGQFDTSDVDGQRSDILRQIKLPVVTPDENQEKCKIHHRAEKFICAGGENRVDACKGNSGGPLMVEFLAENNQPSWNQIGIVSSGFGCANKLAYGRYTDIRAYRQWIKGIMTNNTKARE
ncbi:complement factor B-like isoform X2 [Lineus longissimus]|uniref:complement factor B-like isoform X2 n=1 Tax=Lineus longissimus TaxID=88925 RepID=UPI00315CA2E5